MPTRDSAPLGAPCWIDLFSSDPARAEAFYGQIFGWAAEHTGEEFGGYVNFRKDGSIVAGMMRNDGTTGYPDGWTTYLATPDVQATAEAAVAAGGQVFMAPMQVLHLGSMAVLADVGGAAVGIWQPGAHTGFDLVGEAGAPVWHELYTHEYAAVVDFYRTVFGWDTAVLSDTDEFRYTTMEADGGSHAGIMDSRAFLPDGVPSTWQVYLGAEDVDATLAQVEQLGGSVVQPAKDTPFGRVAQAADPTGAVFKVSSLQP
ncbi:MAG: VOC family protein [Pseudonocardia sp.]